MPELFPWAMLLFVSMMGFLGLFAYITTVEADYVKKEEVQERRERLRLLSGRSTNSTTV